MGFLNDRVLDEGLGVLNGEVNSLHICSEEPSTFAEATSTFTLGNKATPSVGTPDAKGGGGREVTVSAITDGSVTATGTASHWAVVDTVGERLLAAQTLSAPQGVTSGNVFTLTSFTIGIPGPA